MQTVFSLQPFCIPAYNGLTPLFTGASFVNAHFFMNISFMRRCSMIHYTVKSRYLEVDGIIFYKFKLPEVQINLHFG